ncbi:hypothetical protein GCM10007148_22670 [Parvularcula lutaonensis]|nr:hypothetical protein GCM10007148_22670 [Parvularcula lutaonensis]
MPNRQEGFYSAVRSVLTTKKVLREPWLDGIASDFASFPEAGGVDAVEAILETSGYPRRAWPLVIRATLAILPGWAGMFSKFEREADKAPAFALPAKLADWLAVALLLDRAAIRRAARKLGLQTASLMEELDAGQTEQRSEPDATIAFEVFVAAQAFDLVATLAESEEKRRGFTDGIARFSSFERRWILQLAYERRHRQATLDAMIEHTELCGTAKPEAPRLQAVFCMDEREESTRRHLEEYAPGTETFGCAGFFGVAMRYKGLDDVTSRPLCPVVRTPQHYVEEIPVDREEAERYKAALRRRGLALARAEQSERSLLLGSAWALLAGLVEGAHLVARSIAPRFAHHTHHKATHGHHHAPQTRLALFRKDNETTPDGLYRGYSFEEAADIVFGQLTSMGLTGPFAPLVLIAGHGSSSLNNPHEAAHDCGATGGGRGGPNARAFAQMANHPEVRSLLSEKGIIIPDTTWFIGGYHNTCDDSMAYYDEDLVPEHHHQDVAAMKEALAQACLGDAQERCRRFEDAPANIGRREALRIAEAHAQDLAQPRPEYGHATNAVCYIGRRSLTRGLFLDRRAFLISYDPEQDAEGAVLASILEAAGPVGAGINLEYYFSFVDPVKFGCGTKLPHNISGLIGVMDGHSSDLRTGLPWQMVEIHEPVRLLTIVEAMPERLAQIAADSAIVGSLVGNGWIQLVSRHPETGEYARYHDGKFVPHTPELAGFPSAEASHDLFCGVRGHLGFGHIQALKEDTARA